MFDRNKLTSDPWTILLMPPDSTKYYAWSTGRGELDTTNVKEEVVFGDPRYDECAGRIVILTML